MKGYDEFQLEINENIYIFLSSKFMDPVNSWTPWKSTDPRLKTPVLGFPGGAVVENLPANAGDMGSSPGLGGSHMPRSN